MFDNLPSFEVKPVNFQGTFISFNNRVMVWQNNSIVTGYVYLP